MRIFQLRVYMLRNEEILDLYRKVIYPRHLNSYPLFGIDAHGFWTTASGTPKQFFTLLSIPAGENIDQVGKRYMASPEFVEDIRHFDASDIVSVESTILFPSTDSPLR